MWGMSISYDVRFPELYRHAVMIGVEAFFVPAAFLAKLALFIRRLS
jgi:predicted amidohydrolase